MATRPALSNETRNWIAGVIKEEFPIRTKADTPDIKQRVAELKGQLEQNFEWKRRKPHYEYITELATVGTMVSGFLTLGSAALLYLASRIKHLRVVLALSTLFLSLLSWNCLQVKWGGERIVAHLTNPDRATDLTSLITKTQEKIVKWTALLHLNHFMKKRTEMTRSQFFSSFVETQWQRAMAANEQE